MQIAAETIGTVTVVAFPVDEIDAGNAPELKRDVAPILDAGRHVVIDLARLRFIDSSGLGAMLSCLRHVSARGGDLKLCALAPPVRAAFELVRMDRIFEIFATRDDAVRAFTGDSAAAGQP
jgi:anti-sigma B factor antagonist